MFRTFPYIITFSTLSLLGCGSVVDLPQNDGGAPEASQEASLDAAADSALDSGPEACTTPPICDPAIGWYNTCSQSVIGCPDGGTECCDKQAPGCGCGAFDPIGYFCQGTYQGDVLSCQKCGQHCDGGK